MKLLAICSLFVIACGGPVHTAPVPSGCPSATQVALATWHPRTVVGTPAPGVPREGAWMAWLDYRPAEADDAPALGSIEPYEIAKRNLGPLPAQVWLLRDGTATCTAEVVGYAAVDIYGSRSIAAVMTGCPAPDEREVWPTAWISFAGAAPTGCRMVVPVRETPGGELPEAWQAAAPVAACDDCTRQWATDTIAGSPTIDAVTVTDRGTSSPSCADADHDHYAIYATPKDGVAAQLAIDSELDLVGALVDERGTRAVLTIGVDTWTAIDVAADGFAGARTVRWYEAEREAGPRHTLDNGCID